MASHQRAMTDQVTIQQDGLAALLQQPLIETIFRRRTHRVSRGSSLSGRLDELCVDPAAHAAHRARRGRAHQRYLMHRPNDARPTLRRQQRDADHGKPNLTMAGRTAGSPDNAHGTSFFLISDSGTYFLRKLPPPTDRASLLDADQLLARARHAKVRLLDHRIDVPDGNRDFPAYLDSNRFLSNLPGTTILLPVVDLLHQYINGMMYLLTQAAGARPTIVGDRNFYRLAGKRWVRNGFFNPDIKLALSAMGAMRTPIEADLLLQNLMLGADAMGWGRGSTARSRQRCCSATQSSGNGTG
jgi:hypothetical protein